MLKYFGEGFSFSNAFSNAGEYVRSRPNAGEPKPQYSNQIRSPVNVSELKTTAWHTTLRVHRSSLLVDKTNGDNVGFRTHRLATWESHHDAGAGHRVRL